MTVPDNTDSKMTIKFLNQLKYFKTDFLNLYSKETI